MITVREDPVVFEVTATLREWHKIWISLYLYNQEDLFINIGSIITYLIDARAKLISLLASTAPTVTSSSCTRDAASRDQQILELKLDIVGKLDYANRLLNLDLVPRDANFKPVDPVELSPVKLYQLHADAASHIATINGLQDCGVYGSSMSTSSQISADSVSIGNTPNSYHLQLAIKNQCLTSMPPDELVEIFFSVLEIINNNNSTVLFKPISEKFIAQLKKEVVCYGLPNTIFTNIGPINNRDICLLIQVFRVGKMTLTDSYKTTFGKQQSSLNLPNTNLDGSNNSLTSSSKYVPNGLTRSRHSTIGYPCATQKYRRPFGATIVPLKEYIVGSSFKENLMNVKVNATGESEFSQLHELYAKRCNPQKLNQSLPNVTLDLSVKIMSCTQEAIHKIITSQPYCITEKRDFPDVVMPGDFKNDLYLTLESAEFEKGGKSISKNIEASVSLIDKTGIVIDKCISRGSNCDNVSSYKSYVFYHSNSPRWCESIKINVPLMEFDNAHLRIEFRHCSTKERDKKFLGFSFLPLSDEDGTVIPDKMHDLYLYKCDPQLWEDESLNLSKYTSLPYGPAAKLQFNNNKSNLHQSFSHSNREIVSVSTFLLSTKLTQNSDLLKLLKWRELIKRNNQDFEDALKKVIGLKGEEIVKFLQDILDTLFDTFTLYSTSEDDYSALIFKVMVHIFLLLDEPKYKHFQPVLNTYASAHFSATLVYKGLLACVKKCLEYSSIVERHVPIQRCFKAMRYVFQFIVQSKILYSKATGEQNDEPFLNDLRHLFRLFELLLANHSPKLIPIHVDLLESFPGTIEHLIKVVNPQELVDVVITLAGSVGFKDLPPALSQAKLQFMKQVADSELVKIQDIRTQITEKFCIHLRFYIENFEQLDLCYDVLETLIIKVHDYHWSSIYRLYQLASRSRSPSDQSDNVGPVTTVGEINILTNANQIQVNQLDLSILGVARELEPFVVHIIDPLLHLLDNLARNTQIERTLIQKYCTCLLTILKLMGKTSFEQFLMRNQVDYTKLCNLFRALRAVYDRDWSVMQLLSHSILEHSIDGISKDLRDKNKNDTYIMHSTTKQLSSYIKLIVDFIIHPTLQLETFSDRKRDYVLSVFGDLRIKFSAQLMRFWADLSKANICDLIPTLIQSFLDASLLPNDKLQQKLIPVFWDMIDAGDQFKSKSRLIERCLIDHLDAFMNLDRGDENFINNFEKILNNLIKERNPPWGPQGVKLIASFTKLMQLLIAYRHSLEHPETRGKQMYCLVELLNYYKDQDRTDLHLKYLFKLCDMHLEMGNYVEAAFTLKLYTDELKWCDRSLMPLDKYRKEEPEWRRKEALYQQMIEHFDKAKCWEENITLCKELASFYENYLVDYEKVSSTLKKLAHFLDYILTEYRPEREYFKVEFLGIEFTDYVRGKVFIYRGGEYERLPAFMQKMTSEFADAQVLNPMSKLTYAKDSPGQYLVISNVKPVPSLQHHFKRQMNISDKIIQYYLNNRLDTFSYDLPIMKNDGNNHTQKDKSVEVDVKNLWVGRHRLKVKKQLPNILPWSEVISQEYEEISPINHAIENISNMNLELSKLILSYKNDPNKQISPLTMRLQGIIEAAVNGGPGLFVNAFLKKQNHYEEIGDTTSQQYDPESLKKLRDLIKQQFSILETGLALHSKLAPPEVLPLHDRLVERLQSIRRTYCDHQSAPMSHYSTIS